MFLGKARKNLENIFDARLGKIMEVRLQHSNNAEDKRLFCDIELFPSGQFSNVGLWGGGVDLETKFPHGIFSIPRQEQMVLVLFAKGNMENPVAALPLPYNCDMADEVKELYYDLVENINDIGVFHYSGTRIILREDGSIDLQKRIEESTDTFVNHTLKVEFEYDAINSIRKKIITDVDNSTVINLTAEDVDIIDSKNQKFNMHSKDNEESISVLDAASQLVKMYAQSGSNYIEIKRGTNQLIKLENGKNTLKESATQYIEQGASSTDIKGSALNLLAGTQAMIKGNVFMAAWGVMNTAIQGITPSNPVTAAEFTSLQTAIGAFFSAFSNYLSSTIKGE
jgi:hypothetical protein